jgi:hypothetical protein
VGRLRNNRTAPAIEKPSPRSEGRADDAYRQLDHDRHQWRAEGHRKTAQGSGIKGSDGEGIGQLVQGAKVLHLLNAFSQCHGVIRQPGRRLRIVLLKLP